MVKKKSTMKKKVQFKMTRNYFLKTERSLKRKIKISGYLTDKVIKNKLN